MTLLKNIYTFLFGKSYKHIWQQFANENNGVYTKGYEDKVELIYKRLTLVFDSHTHYVTAGTGTLTQKFTRIQVHFKSPDQLKFRLTKQGVPEIIGKFFGLQDIVIGDKAFDKRFLIKGNDETKVQIILSNTALRELILKQKFLRLEITENEGLYDEKVPEGYSLLYYISEEKITTIEQLNDLLKLYTKLIDKLIQTSSLQRSN